MTVPWLVVRHSVTLPHPVVTLHCQIVGLPVSAATSSVGTTKEADPLGSASLLVVKQGLEPWFPP